MIEPVEQLTPPAAANCSAAIPSLAEQQSIMLRLSELEKNGSTRAAEYVRQILAAQQSGKTSSINWHFARRAAGVAGDV